MAYMLFRKLLYLDKKKAECYWGICSDFSRISQRQTASPVCEQQTRTSHTQAHKPKKKEEFLYHITCGGVCWSLKAVTKGPHYSASIQPAASPHVKVMGRKTAWAL